MKPLAWVAGIITGFALSAVLSGCASAPTVQDFASACDAYGFDRSSVAHAQCVQTAIGQYNAGVYAQRANMQAVGSSLMLQGELMRQQEAQRPAAVYPYTPTIRCQQMAGYVQCR